METENFMDILKKIVPVLMLVFFASGCATAISGKKGPSDFQVKMKHVKATPNISLTGPVEGKCVKTRFLCFSSGSEKQADGLIYDRIKADDYTTKWWFLGGLYGAGIYAGREYMRRDAVDGDDYQRAAVYDATQIDGVDVIIDPQFIIEKKKGFLNITETVVCTVKGTGARINSIDKIDYVMPPEPELSMLESLKAKVTPDEPEEDKEVDGGFGRILCPYTLITHLFDFE